MGTASALTRGFSSSCWEVDQPQKGLVRCFIMRRDLRCRPGFWFDRFVGLNVAGLLTVQCRPFLGILRQVIV